MSLPLDLGRVAINAMTAMQMPPVVIGYIPMGLALLAAAIWLLEVAVPPLIWISLLRIRTVVTPSFVSVDWGVFGGRIPLDALRTTRVGRSSEKPGWSWVFGRRRRGLIRTFSKGKGERTIFLPSERPESLVAAVAEARGATGPRIAGEQRDDLVYALPDEPVAARSASANILW